MDEYIDLTDNYTNLENYSICVSGFNCKLSDVNGKQYKGLLLAKSDKGEAYTICNVDFQWSQKDSKILDSGVIRTIDPEAIFIVGSKEREIPRSSCEVSVQTKRDTLERFIRNNRNVNIISYDELYRRA